MAGGSTIPANKPNGVLTVFYGNGASCIKCLLDKTDWADAMKRPDKAMWALSAQSGTVIDGAGFPGNTFMYGCYRGYE
jgi:hypothetical protein